MSEKSGAVAETREPGGGRGNLFIKKVNNTPRDITNQMINNSCSTANKLRSQKLSFNSFPCEYSNNSLS